jgi:hypothetical protein
MRALGQMDNAINRGLDSGCCGWLAQNVCVKYRKVECAGPDQGELSCLGMADRRRSSGLIAPKTRRF